LRIDKIIVLLAPKPEYLIEKLLAAGAGELDGAVLDVPCCHANPSPLVLANKAVVLAGERGSSGAFPSFFIR
jgi:hypothetical protein